MYHRRKFVWTPRRAAAAVFIALLFAFVASWTSLPARAGGSAPSIAAPAPRHMLAVRTGVVYPLNLPPPSAQASSARHSRLRRIANPFGYSQRQTATATDEILPAMPSLATIALTATPTLASAGFAGLAFPNSQCGPGCEPPDGVVAAGPNNVVELTNIVGRIFDKSGNDLKDFNLNTLFGVATDIFSSDPRIEYDTLSQRWFISFLTLDTTDPTTAQNGFWNLAVSIDSNPIDGFNTYQVETPGDFPDQPPLGFNDDKVVTGGNSFSCTVSMTDPGSPNCDNGNYEGNEFLVWNKSELLAGDAMIDTDYNPPGADSSDFPIIPVKSRTSTSTLWMVSACVTGFSECDNMLNVWSITGVPGVGGDSSPNLTTLALAEIDPPPVAPQKGNTNNPIDTADGRLLDAAFRDGLLWASGNASCTPSGDTIARSCLQYVEVMTSGASPTVGRDFAFGTKGAYNYYPSIDLDSSDDLITSFTQSSGAEFPSAYVDGRLKTEVNNVLGTPVVIQAGTASYNSPNPEPDTNAFPWGDYSGAGIDPIDQTAVWVAAEYSASVPTPLATPNWGTWIAEARVISPSPTPTSTGSPTPTATATSTATATPTASATATPTASGSPTASATATATATATGTATSTASGSPTTSASATPTASGSPTTSASATPTASATATSTSTSTASASATATSTSTSSATVTPTATATATSTATATASAT